MLKKDGPPIYKAILYFKAMLQTIRECYKVCSKIGLEKLNSSERLIKFFRNTHRNREA